MKTIRDAWVERKYRQYIDEAGDPVEVVEDDHSKMMEILKRQAKAAQEAARAAEQKAVMLS